MHLCIGVWRPCCAKSGYNHAPHTHTHSLSTAWHRHRHRTICNPPEAHYVTRCHHPNFSLGQRHPTNRPARRLIRSNIRAGWTGTSSLVGITPNGGQHLVIVQQACPISHQQGLSTLTLMPPRHTHIHTQHRPASSHVSSAADQVKLQAPPPKHGPSLCAQTTHSNCQTLSTHQRASA